MTEELRIGRRLRLYLLSRDDQLLGGGYDVEEIMPFGMYIRFVYRKQREAME